MRHFVGRRALFSDPSKRIFAPQVGNLDSVKTPPTFEVTLMNIP
jgi:hypothetical protein